jgi:phage terminase large subunit-like protein
VSAGGRSLAEALARLPLGARRAVLETIDERTAVSLLHDWRVWARPNQLPPDGEWDGWLVMAGRGFGKNRLGAEFVHDEVLSGRAGRVALIARTSADVRDTLVEGEAGIMTVAKPWAVPTYEPSKRRITWPNGAKATTFGAEEPALLRGPEHDLVWGDEVSTWQYEEAWHNAMLGLRIGRARWLATMTPKRTPLVLRLLADAERAPDKIRVTYGSTYDNLSNLAPSYIERVVRFYEGTTLAGQELYGKLLTDDPDALFKRDVVHRHRWLKDPPPMDLVVVAVDPAASATQASDETGIVAGGRFYVDGVAHAVVIADRSGVFAPEEWSARVARLYDELKADEVVGEANNGGDMVVSVIRHVLPSAKVEKVHASRGKRVRAEPVSVLYQQGRVHHLGQLPELEDQMCTWVPGRDADSPDRLDALVWLVTRLLDAKQPRYGVEYGVSRG